MGRADKRASKASAKGWRKGSGGFIFGAVAGAVAGLMLAPRSGKETRAQLLGEGSLGDQMLRLKGAVGAGKESAADQSDALRRKIEATRERIRTQMGAGDEAAGTEAGAGGTDAAGSTDLTGGEPAPGVAPAE